MTEAQPRTRDQRRADTLAKLTARRHAGFFVLRPVRIQAWREVDELPGRTLMRDGAWLA